MSTRRLYYDDAYVQNFDATVLQCEPVAAVSTESGPVPAWEVILDCSAFYPTSGGQPHDLGLLGQANVIDVRDSDDEIVHIVDHELPRGTVQGCVQWPRRFDHMQQHTGQHLLSAMFHERFGLPTVSFHLGSEFCSIDLHGPEPALDVILGAQRAANRIVFEDRLVTVRYGTASQFAELGVRREVDRPGLLRAIEIESADLQPCGGTHVKSTGQIGLILVRGREKIREDWRVEFVCGSRAERVATADLRRLRDLCERLSCGPEEAVAVVERAFAERDSHFKNLRAAIQQLAEARAAVLVSSPERSGEVRVVAEVLRDSHPNLLLALATEIAKNDRTVALLFDQDSGQLVFAQHSSARKDLAALLKQVLAQIPGKGGGTHDFVRAKLNDPSATSQALQLAQQLVGNL